MLIVGVRNYIKESILGILEVHAEVGIINYYSYNEYFKNNSLNLEIHLKNTI